MNNEITHSKVTVSQRVGCGEVYVQSSGSRLEKEHLGAWGYGWHFTEEEAFELTFKRRVKVY